MRRLCNVNIETVGAWYNGRAGFVYSFQSYRLLLIGEGVILGLFLYVRTCA